MITLTVIAFGRTRKIAPSRIASSSSSRVVGRPAARRRSQACLRVPAVQTIEVARRPSLAGS